jgi:uncharacterized membrane-anchored protein YjiN (DUF445 family)
MTDVGAPDLGALLGDGRSEDERRAALRRAKRGATGLLGVAAVVYLLTFLADDGEAGVVGFVRAAAEAGMVGGLADWFAVTALFRHPLGIPVPHTALVPRRKDALAASLGDFVTGHFLTAANVRARLADADVVGRVGRWVRSGDVADRLGREVVATSAAALQALKPEDVTDLALEVLRRDSARRSYAALAGRLLADVTAGGAHRPLLDVALPYLRQSLDDNRDVVRATVKEVVERGPFLMWLFTTDRRIHKLLDSASELLRDMERDPDHELRAALDRLLRTVADDLRGGGELARRVDALVADVLRDPTTREWVLAVVADGVVALRDTLGDTDGPGPARVAATLREVAERAVDDAAFRARLDRLLENAVLYVVEHYAGEFTGLIEDTVARWDGPATADRIELAAGRDLQFIRINGTVVGALAGLAIHTVAVLLG